MPIRLRLATLLFLLLASPLVHLRADDVATTDLDTACDLFNERRYAEAQPLFEAALAAEPNNTTALLHLGKLAAKRRERELAVDYLQRAVDLEPDNAEFQFEYGAACSLHAGSLGTSFGALRQAHRGRKAMERAVELAPENLIFRQGLLEFYATAPGIAGGSMRKAFEQAEAIATRDADQGAFARANLQRAEDDHAGALATLGGILERAPDNYFALYQFGRCAAESGLELERGLAALQHCLELPAPDKGAPPAYVWWRIGEIQAQRGDPSAAREAAARALELAPNDQRLARGVADIAKIPDA
ncbi:tetratricopeptide repeat protein [Actomonas aquatica]|uniref:Tetratricopeptide repeat protein n=1 Tax=Actomonas aquatica TaxID=2866162 RepID=A0ABZ1CC29_9BACT|nr:tetratricopeptide repeat protein [Opitutus sp. WL0086]WRQ88867.1 tetratricopeptide repeat protein [Opitutus sp. WL0086]